MSDQAPGAVLRGAVDLSSLRNRANQAAAPASAPSGATSYIVDITDATFQQVLDISRGVPVVVDMWAGWSEASTQLSAAHKQQIYAGNARRVYPRLDAALKHRGL